MKRIVLIAIVTALCFSLNAFQEGTINVGGSASLSVTKLNEDAKSIRTISFRPQVGYFVMDNLVADLLFGFSNARQSIYRETRFSFGLGGRYFINQFYGGLGFFQEAYRAEASNIYSHKESATYYMVRTGYLIRLTENTFVDLGLQYQSGIGEYGGDAEGDNEWQSLRLITGLQFFF